MYNLWRHLKKQVYNNWSVDGIPIALGRGVLNGVSLAIKQDDTASSTISPITGDPSWNYMSQKTDVSEQDRGVTKLTNKPNDQLITQSQGKKFDDMSSGCDNYWGQTGESTLEMLWKQIQKDWEDKYEKALPAMPHHIPLEELQKVSYGTRKRDSNIMSPGGNYRCAVDVQSDGSTVRSSNSIEGSEEQQTNKMKYGEVGIQKEVSTIISRPTVMEEGVCLPENKVTNNGTMKSMLGIGREG